jgi:hypothetical protein
MNQPDGQDLLTTNESGIVSGIHEMFERYGPTFVDLAVGRRTDIDALLQFYS